jgi:hypothetical protein
LSYWGKSWQEQRRVGQLLPEEFNRSDHFVRSRR